MTTWKLLKLNFDCSHSNLWLICRRCRCTCGKHMNRSTNMHMSRSRLFRSHSDSIHPPSGCCVHPGRPNGKESKQVRLSIPQRSMSVMIEPAVVHLQEDGKHHLHHRRQRSLSPQSLHRHLRSKHPNQAMDQLHSGCSSSGWVPFSLLKQLDWRFSCL